MDVFFKLFKIFFDESSKKTILAIVITLIIYYVTPNGFPMLVKFTLIGYLIFWFLVSFLVLSPILGICRGLDGYLVMSLL